MPDSVTFAGQMLFKPSKALRRLQSDDAGLWPAAIIYALFLFTAVIFYTLKPEDFPTPDQMGAWSLAVERGQRHDLFFWAKVQSWSPFLTGVEVFCLAWFSWLIGGATDKSHALIRLLKRLGIAGLAILPFVPILLYKYDAISKTVFGLLLAAMVALMIPGLRRREAGAWKSLAALSMSLNVINLALLIPFTICVMVRWEAGYNGMELLMMIWTLALGSYLLAGLEAMSSARAFMTLMLAVVFCPMMFVISAYLLGLVPREILKAMMTV